MNNKELQAVIEGLLFVSGDDGLSLVTIQEVFPEEKPSVIRAAIDELIAKYAKDLTSALAVQKFGGNKFRMQTKPILHDYIAKLNLVEEHSKLSNSVVEVLSVIAYRGPITKGEIDDIRNADSAYQLQKLRDRKLVEATGKSEENPRANIYQITDNFFKIFNLNSKADIPVIDFNDIKTSDDLIEEHKTQSVKDIFGSEPLDE